MISKSIVFVDSILNKFTMYRLALYYLTVLWLFALFLMIGGVFPFKPLDFLIFTFLILSFSYVINKLFEILFKSITNFESVFITALILSLIITPSLSLRSLEFSLLAVITAIASKFIFAFHKKNFFNPAAIGVFLPSIILLGSASWWIGNPIENIVVLLGGILLVRKIQRFQLIIAYLISFTFLNILLSLLNNIDVIFSLSSMLVNSSTLFFCFVMLTEPSTTPPKVSSRTIYGIISGTLSYFIPFEQALLIGNIYSYFFSAKSKFILALNKKTKLAQSIYEFVFEKPENFDFQPGQYMDWTIKSSLPDSRGNRRYFTISSSPTENTLNIGVRIEENMSYFKRKLANLNLGDVVFAGNTTGDFLMPKTDRSLVFIAGGIGITPFRSMIKYLLDKNVKKNITLFYSNKTKDEISYKEIFDQANEKLGIKTVYNLTDTQQIPKNWDGYKGRLSEEILKNEAPYFEDALYYLSGPHAMVVAFEELLNKMGVSKINIKKDFFPGY